MNKYYITIKISFGKNTNGNPNNYRLIKTFEFNCCLFEFVETRTKEIKIMQNQNIYNFALDEIEEIFIKAI